MFLHRLLFAGAAVSCLAFSSATPDRAPEPKLAMAASKTPCCFKNPGYTGICKVEPAEDETCASILAYLNNPMAQGKSYCDGTNVRQGWTETTCEGSTTGVTGRRSTSAPAASTTSDAAPRRAP